MVRLGILTAVLVCVAACTQPTTPLPTATPISEPTSTPTPTPTSAPTPTPTYTPTPTQPPELVKPTPVSADEELRTIRSKASGILFEVPVSWEPVQTNNGLKIQDKHGDVLIGNSSRPFEDLVAYTDAYIDSLNQYFENERTVLDDKVISTGFFGNAYRKFVFFENGLGRIAMISFTANPQYLDEYIHKFEKIEASLKITPVGLNENNAPSTLDPTPTPTPMLVPTPTPTLVPTPTTANINLNGEFIPALTEAGMNYCDPRFSATAFCIELLTYPGLSAESTLKAVDGLTAIVARYPVTLDELRVDWSNFGPDGGYQSYLGLVLWHTDLSPEEQIVDDLCLFKDVAKGENIRIEAEECAEKQLKVLEGVSPGGAKQSAGNRKDNGYAIYASNNMMDKYTRPPTAPARETFSDPRKVIAHEYFHSYQSAHAVNMEGGASQKNMGPLWLIEGSAEYAAVKASSLEGWMDWDSQMQVRMEQSIIVLKDHPDLSLEDNVTFADKENNKAISKNVSHVLTYELAAWAMAYAISISSHDAVMIKYWDDLEAYGYEESFARNIGLSLEEFYSEFGAFRGKTIGGQMDIIPQQINY